MSTKYYLLIDEEREGPFEAAQLVDAGMTWDTLVWFKGCKDWVEAHEVAELAALLDEPPPRSRADPSIDLRKVYSETQLRRPCSIGVAMYAVVGILAAVAAALGLLAFWIDKEIVRDRSLQWIQTTSILVIIGCGAVALVCLIAAWIAFLVFLYRAWGAIQDGRTNVYPGSAVGFLFIPVFQFYWIFVATLGLARALNDYANRHRLRAPPAPVMLGAALSLYFVLAAIPFLGVVPVVLNLLIVPLFMRAAYRTARCFLPENEMNIDAADKHAVPARGFKASAFWAVLAAPAGLTALALGVVFGLENWMVHEAELRNLERMQKNLARLEQVHRLKNAQPPNNDIRRTQEHIDRLERFFMPRTIQRLATFGLTGIVGFVLCLTAIGLGLYARRAPIAAQSVELPHGQPGAN